MLATWKSWIHRAEVPYCGTLRDVGIGASGNTDGEVIATDFTAGWLCVSVGGWWFIRAEATVPAEAGFSWPIGPPKVPGLPLPLLVLLLEAVGLTSSCCSLASSCAICLSASEASTSRRAPICCLRRTQRFIHSLCSAAFCLGAVQTTSRVS